MDIENYIPDIKVKDLTLGTDIYSSEKLSSLLSASYVVVSNANEAGELAFSKNLSPLNIVTMNAEDYVLLPDESKQDDTIYLVQSDYLDAFNKRVVNVANPIAETDAANKKYVDTLVNKDTFESLPEKTYYFSRVYNDNCDSIVSAQFQLDYNICGLPANTDVIVKSMTFHIFSHRDNSMSFTNYLISDIDNSTALTLTEKDDIRAVYTTSEYTLIQIYNDDILISQSTANEYIPESNIITFKFTHEVKLNTSTKYTIRFCHTSPRSSEVLITGEDLNDRFMNLHLLKDAPSQFQCKAIANSKDVLFSKAAPNALTITGFTPWIVSVGIAQNIPVIKSLIMPDSNGSGDKYSVCIKNSQIEVQKI